MAKILIKKSQEVVEKAQNNKNQSQDNKNTTLSDLNVPVFVMCPPIHAQFQIANNVWMEEYQKNGQAKINIEKFVYEWSCLYSALAQEGIVMTFPTVEGLQDLTFVNSFAYLPHIKEPKTCIISRFKAEGRQPEEQVAYDFLTKCGYTCYQPPKGYYWEGEACLKYLRDDIYISSYGVRNTKEALDWIARNFECQVIKLCQETEELYHTDCLVFPITPFDVLVAVKHADKSELKKLENVANIIPIEDEGLLEVGIMNSIAVGYTVYTSDNDLAFKGQRDLIDLEKKKRETMCKIAANLGMEVIFIPFTEALKLGAMPSCCVTRLNYADKYQMILWKEGINSLAVDMLENLPIDKSQDVGEIF